MPSRVQTLHVRNLNRIEAVLERYAILRADAPDVVDARRTAFEAVFGTSFGAVDMDALADDLAARAEAFRAEDRAASEEEEENTE